MWRRFSALDGSSSITSTLTMSVFNNNLSKYCADLPRLSIGADALSLPRNISHESAACGGFGCGPVRLHRYYYPAKEPSLIVRNLDGAAANELAHDRVPRNYVVARDLCGLQTSNRFEQFLNALVANSGIQETSVGSKVFQARQQAIGSDEKRPKRRQ